MASSLKTALAFFVPKTLKVKLILLVTGLIALLFFLSSAATTSLIGDLVQEQMGQRGLQVAETVALIPAIRDALAAGDPRHEIQPLAEKIRKATGSEYVVVGDRQGRRYSHPDPRLIGKIMSGEGVDNAGALKEGKSYVSLAMGTRGLSIRGKAPIFDRQGKIIGLVSVGYFIEDIKDRIRRTQREIVPFLAIALGLGVVGAIGVATHFKKAIFGLEPEEIASLFRERSAILESIREGVLAIDHAGAVTMVNPAALKNIGLDSADEAVGRSVAELLPEAGMETVLASGERRLDRELLVNGAEMVFNMIPIYQDREINGVVASFRRKDELDILARELSSLRQYTDMLRAQTHEYANKLHTIAGLIQLESYGEALELIVREGSHLQDLVELLARIAPDPVLAALIIGKYNVAQEWKIGYTVDPESTLAPLPAGFDTDALVTILGNLLDNALEAVRDQGEGEVRLFFSGSAQRLLLVVEDSGPGVATAMAERIFQKGVSTKNRPGHGVGLHLVARTLEALHGSIALSGSSLGGARFAVTIPLDS